jgi:hypothetical protein
MNKCTALTVLKFDQVEPFNSAAFIVIGKENVPLSEDTSPIEIEEANGS